MNCSPGSALDPHVMPGQSRLAKMMLVALCCCRSSIMGYLTSALYAGLLKANYGRQLMTARFWEGPIDMTEHTDSGIEAIGDIPWGSHFCQFYETPEDMVGTIVPYFKAG